MEIRGYKRIKKKDIKRWFKGSNLVLYVLILLLLFALIMFAYMTIAGMHNDNIDNELNNQTEDLDNESSLQEETSTYIAVNKNIKTGSTVISEKAEWRKLDNNGYAHYSSRLDNSEYICSTAYFTKTIGNMNIDEYNKIGTSLTYGSIFMAPADAKWIYNNCGINTSVEILSDFDIPSDADIKEFKKYNYIDKLEE